MSEPQDHPSANEVERETTTLLDLPPELILLIAHHLNVPDLNSLICSSAYLHEVLSPLLYKRGATYARRWGIKPLIWAVIKGHNSAVERLLENGADPYVETDGSTAYHAAAKGQNIRALASLLGKAPAPSTEDGESGMTPLQLAVQSNNAVMTRMMLDAARGKWPDQDGEWIYSLSLAVGKGYIDIARCLLEAAGNMCLAHSQAPAVDSHCLLNAATKGDIAMIQLLAEFGWRNWGAMVYGKEIITPLHAAAREGRIELTELLLSYGSDINATDHNSRTPLYCASAIKEHHVTELLLKAGADPNIGGKEVTTHHEMATPLHTNASHGRITMSLLLLAGGATVNAADQLGCTPLQYAVQWNRLPVMEILIEAGADISARTQKGRSALYIAAYRGHDKAVDLLLSHGAHAEAGRETDSFTSPLFAAIEKGRVDFLKRLVAAGFKLNPGPGSNMIPLFHAVKYNQLSVIRELVRCGADVRTLKEDGSSILHEAAKHAAKDEIIQYLIDQGADVHAVGPQNQTALHYAMRFVSSFSTGLVLLNAGISASARDTNGATALHHSVRTSGKGMKELLIAGADVNAQDGNGMTPLLLAASSYRFFPHVLYALLDAGADVTVQDKSGQTALHYVARSYNDPLFGTLLKRHSHETSEFMTPDKQGLTVADKAIKFGHVPIMSMLADTQRHGAGDYALRPEQRALIEEMVQRQVLLG
ncbi:uncharacterized protein DSM5745_04461 [Aspergillus mulundensis]|uniref:F-box domain-containing protein n=1 Tax=Aspergillus mulundensis TaxID=1810919 RepID=A0A3D8SCR6_9EURO|nr:hypothetical protein DSM5745_04461 [Aspergillus mulundensis]RDW84135.1 hypothetical protein DSM5745_04461 [Aspergillus mulundensis]